MKVARFNIMIPTAAELTVLRAVKAQADVSAFTLARARVAPRNSVHQLLRRLREKGLVSSRKTERGVPGAPRPLYRVTARGERMLAIATEIDSL